MPFRQNATIAFDKIDKENSGTFLSKQLDKFMEVLAKANLLNSFDIALSNVERLMKTDAKALSSKYNSRFTYVANAPLKEIETPQIEKTTDTIISGKRHIKKMI